MEQRNPDEQAAPIAASELKQLQQRSDLRGLLRLAGHLAWMGSACALYAVAIAKSWHPAWILLAGTALGFTMVTMFACMHECVHRTAFRSAWLNEGVGWFAGLLSFYNSTFYRHYHTWHHRFTQIPGKDPELEDTRPTSLGVYAVEMSGVTWWIGKFKTHFTLAAGRTGGFPFLNENTAPGAVRSVRVQLATYAAFAVASLVLGGPYLLVYWVVPVALGQPLLRLILLAEHTGCTEDDNMLTNTRTTHTIWPVRFLMWEMPYHAEHHRYPALPFFALRAAHERMGQRLSHVARRGYTGFHVEVLRGLWRRPSARSAA
ncbi:MAG: fatty acid desaturase [Myxococcales bacterium]